MHLAQVNPDWRFVGVDPAKSMLKKCQEKLETKKLLDRCELFHGYLDEYDSDVKFDAVLCLFVMHFINDLQERSQMLLDIKHFLKSDGVLVNAEISVDVKSSEYEQLIENWKSVHALAGASEVKLENMPKVIEEELGVISPEKTRDLIIKNGFKNPVPFFQSFLIRGWYSVKG